MTMTNSLPQKGFTLVEIMVAVSLFIVVAFIATSSFTSFAEVNRRAQALRSSIDNLNFAMESMVLKLREGNDYTCAAAADPCTAIAFTADNGNTVEYRFKIYDDIGTIEKCEKDVGACANFDFVPIVAVAVNVDRLNFYIDNSERPLVKIVIRGLIDTQTGGAREFILQTTVSQRP